MVRQQSDSYDFDIMWHVVCMYALFLTMSMEDLCLMIPVGVDVSDVCLLLSCCHTTPKHSAVANVLIPS